MMMNWLFVLFSAAVLAGQGAVAVQSDASNAPKPPGPCGDDVAISLRDDPKGLEADGDPGWLCVKTTGPDKVFSFPAASDIFNNGVLTIRSALLGLDLAVHSRNTPAAIAGNLTDALVGRDQAPKVVVAPSSTGLVVRGVPDLTMEMGGAVNPFVVSFTPVFKVRYAAGPHPRCLAVRQSNGLDLDLGGSADGWVTGSSDARFAVVSVDQRDAKQGCNPHSVHHREFLIARTADEKRLVLAMHIVVGRTRCQRLHVGRKIHQQRR